MSGYPSTSHRRSQLLCRDSGRQDDLKGARENNLVCRGFLDFSEAQKNPHYPYQATEIRTQNVLLTMSQAKTRLLNARTYPQWL